MKILKILPLILLLLCCTWSSTALFAQPEGCEGCDASTNLVSNGDFSANQTTLIVPTSSSLDPICSCFNGAGTAAYGSYCIETDAHNKCASFDPILDHTNPGVSRFMVVDGFPSTDPPLPNDPNIVWKQEIIAPAPGFYEFSFWCIPNLSSWNSITPVFDMRVDYQAVESGVGVGATLDEWNEYCITVELETAGSHVIEIGQTNTGGLSNDYGIDDIFFGNCCTCGVEADFTFAAVPPNFTVSFNSTSTFNSCTTPRWYDWDFGDGNTAAGSNVSTPVHTYAAGGWYTVCLTVMGVDNAGNTCESSICYDEVYVPEEGECEVQADFNLNGSINLVTMTNNSTNVSTIDQWTYTIFPPNQASYSITNQTIGNNAATSPGWNQSFVPTSTGTYLVYLTVYDYDLPECYSTTRRKIYIDRDEDPTNCDVQAGYVASPIPGPGSPTYQFNNTSTASSAMTYNWTINPVGGSYIYSNNTLDITYTFPAAGDYNVCLNVAQPAGGGECFSQFCDVITIDDVEDYLYFTLQYVCGDEPELFIDFLATNDTDVTIETTCSGAATVVNPGINPYSMPLPLPLVVATEPNYTYSSCVVQAKTVNLAPQLVYNQYIYFNCQACPGVPRSEFEEGSNDLTTASQLSVYPNPGKAEEMRIRLKNMTGPTRVEVLNIKGQTIRTINLDIDVPNVQMPFSTIDLAAGVYLVRATSDTGQLVQRVVVE